MLPSEMRMALGAPSPWWKASDEVTLRPSSRATRSRSTAVQRLGNGCHRWMPAAAAGNGPGSNRRANCWRAWASARTPSRNCRAVPLAIHCVVSTPISGAAITANARIAASTLRRPSSSGLSTNAVRRPGVRVLASVAM